MPVREVTLETICGGGLPEIFQRELADVMSNIVDVNTDPKKARTITIAITIHPNADRTNCSIELGVTSKTIPVVKIAGSLYIAQTGEKFKAYSADVRQQDIFAADEKEAGEKRPHAV